MATIRVLSEIKYYQKSFHQITSRRAVTRIIKEIMANCDAGDMRITDAAKICVQEAMEFFIAMEFRMAYNNALACGRVTLRKGDLLLLSANRLMENGYTVVPGESTSYTEMRKKDMIREKLNANVMNATRESDGQYERDANGKWVKKPTIYN